MKYIFLYWDVHKWITEPNAMMIKDVLGKCHSNGAVVLTTLGVGGHRMLGDLMSSMIYETVSEKIVL